MQSLPYSIRCLGFAALVCAGQASHAQSSADLYAGVTTVEVFANMAMQVASNPNAHYKMSVYRLDAMQGIEAIANKGLPQNETEAREWVKKNEARIRKETKPLVQSAVAGMLQAKKYKIDRLPAVVVNNRYVVYGYANVDHALMALRAKSQKK